MKRFLAPASSARRAMLAILLAGALLPASVLAAEQPVPIAELAKHTHFHGIAAHADPSGGIYLATHHGLFRVDGRGLAMRVSASADDFMGFTPHPTRPEVLYASGHPARGGNLASSPRPIRAGPGGSCRPARMARWTSINSRSARPTRM